MPKIKTVLVADDESLVRELLSLKLREKGYEVFEAADGQETLQIVQDKMPELVLLDVKMPEVDGFQVCRTIKKSEKLNNIKIVMFSAKAELVDRHDGLRAGADYYLTKPARFGEILKVIEGFAR